MLSVNAIVSDSLETGLLLVVLWFFVLQKLLLFAADYLLVVVDFATDDHAFALALVAVIVVMLFVAVDYNLTKTKFIYDCCSVMNVCPSHRSVHLSLKSL